MRMSSVSSECRAYGQCMRNFYAIRSHSLINFEHVQRRMLAYLERTRRMSNATLTSISVCKRMRIQPRTLMSYAVVGLHFNRWRLREGLLTRYIHIPGMRLCATVGYCALIACCRGWWELALSAPSPSAVDLTTVRPKWRLDGPGLSGHPFVITCQSSLCKFYQYHQVWF